MSGLLGLFVAVMSLGAPELPPADNVIETTPFLRSELRTLAKLEPEIEVLRWRHDMLWLKAKVWLTNRQPTWMGRVRVDFVAVDEAQLAKPIYASFLFQQVGPGERQGRLTGDLVVRVPPDLIGQVRYKTSARIVAATRLKQRSRR